MKYLQIGAFQFSNFGPLTEMKYQPILLLSPIIMWCNSTLVNRIESSPRNRQISTRGIAHSSPWIHMCNVHYTMLNLVIRYFTRIIVQSLDLIIHSPILLSTYHRIEIISTVLCQQREVSFPLNSFRIKPYYDNVV